MGELDEVAFLAGSRYRADIVRLLKTEGELSKATLRRECEASYVTLTRNLEQLQERYYVTERDGRFRLTAAGSLLAEEFFEALDAAELAAKLRPFLRWVPETEFDLDLESLRNAEVVVGESSTPYAPMNRHLDVLRQGNQVKEVLPAIAVNSVRTIREAVIDGDAEHHIVIAPSVLETLRTHEQLRADFEEVVSEDCVTVSVYHGEIPYSLSIIDDVVHIGSQDDNGHPRALIRSDNDRVRDWAEKTYSFYHEAAEPLSWPP